MTWQDFLIALLIGIVGAESELLFLVMRQLMRDRRDAQRMVERLDEILGDGGTK